MIELSLVIITWNQCDRLNRCLHSISSSDNGTQTIEIIIIDNNSSDNTESIVKRHIALGKQKIRLLRNQENRGVAPARNQGIALAQGRYIMMLDDDTEVTNGCLKNIIAFMDSHPECWCAGTKQIRPDGGLEYNARTFYSLATIIARRTFLGFFMKKVIRQHLLMDWDHNSNREVDWVAGASFVMRQEAIQKIGAFDDRFFFGFEDVDWCYRVKLAERKTYYLADAAIIHHVQGSSRKPLSMKALLHFLSAIRYCLKHKVLLNS